VGPHERETGFLAVVEQNIPGFGAVAIAARVTIRAAVLIVQTVTIRAPISRRLELSVGMTTQAGCVRVTARQRKIGGAVIESGGLPSIGIVAVAAGRSELPAVGIIVFMATVAIGGCFGMAGGGLMTTGAALRTVSADQRKIRQFVIEEVDLQADDVGGSTLVFRMTLFAVGGACLDVAPVKPVCRCQIQCDWLVAFEAQAPLRSRVKEIMARAALFLDVRVVLDDRSGHDQSFEAG